MHAFRVAADVIMGLILGVFLFVVVSRTWSALDHPAMLAITLLGSVVVVLFRRPNGSLARRVPDRR